MKWEMEGIRCYECGKVIESVDDLMVVFIYLSMVPLCVRCFGEIHKKTWFNIYPRTPINYGFWGEMAWTFIPYFIWALIVTALISSLARGASGLWKVYAFIWGIPIVSFAIAVLVRYIAWVRYEKPLLERQKTGRGHA